MKIDNDVKLDFDDVLLVPQRSKAASRKDVDLKRTFKFYHSNRDWNGVPIIAANMDTTGTFGMGTSLSAHDCLTCLSKHYQASSVASYYSVHNNQSNVWVSVGMEDDSDKISEITDTLGHSPNICIDVANGYTEKFIDRCASIRRKFNDSIIMAGNICTPEMVSELILHGGVDVVKVGIGPGSACTTRLKAGCFAGFSKVNTINGLKQIKDIDVGEKVLTHDGSYHIVTKVHNNGFKDNVIEINGITCTDDHKFYVINKTNKDEVNEGNIHEFAYWLAAKDISKEKHFIIEIS
jgi:hypothetical protein